MDLARQVLDHPITVFDLIMAFGGVTVIAAATMIYRILTWHRR